MAILPNFGIRSTLFKIVSIDIKSIQAKDVYRWKTRELCSVLWEEDIHQRTLKSGSSSLWEKRVICEKWMKKNVSSTWSEILTNVTPLGVTNGQLRCRLNYSFTLEASHTDTGHSNNWTNIRSHYYIQFQIFKPYSITMIYTILASTPIPVLS